MEPISPDYSGQLDQIISLLNEIYGLLSRLVGLTEHITGSWYVWLVLVIPLYFIVKFLYWFFTRFM